MPLRGFPQKKTPQVDPRPENSAGLSIFPGNSTGRPFKAIGSHGMIAAFLPHLPDKFHHSCKCTIHFGSYGVYSSFKKTS